MWDALEPGDTVLVHSSIRRTCQEHGLTPDGVLDSLLDRIGDSGTLILPTFTYDGWCHGEPFDVNTTPSRMGALTEAGRKRAGAVRTGNPMYSFVALGKRAGDFYHWDNQSGYGQTSPFYWLRSPQIEGVIASIDLPPNCTNTIVHHVEEVMKVPYRYYKDFPGEWTGWDGETQHKVYKLYVRDLDLGWKTDISELDQLLWKKGLYKGNRPMVGDGMRVVKAHNIFAITQQIIIMGLERKYLGNYV